MNGFSEQLSRVGLDRHLQQWAERIESVTADDVRGALDAAGRFSLKRLTSLISPAAEEFLEEMACRARNLTIRRFGRTMQMYAPLYVSNDCVSHCVYRGFNAGGNIERTRLTVEQAEREADILARAGFRHILLVSGEDRQYASPDYFAELTDRLRSRFSSISIEIYPMSEAEYRRMFESGVDGVTLYQETYDRTLYEKVHPAGPKRDYDYRLQSPERFAEAGMRRLGLGFLLGLGKWRPETLALAMHADYLARRYWRSQVSFSFARLRPAANVADAFDQPVSDRHLVQMMCALRLCFSDAGIVLSTRENAELRDNLINICVTQISAGSKTSPGGYSGREKSLEQFEVDDTRSPRKIAEVIKAAGKEPVWKDWDRAFIKA